MARIVWNDPATRFYEAGLDRGVLYANSQPGVPWTGLVSVGEAPTGGDISSYYLDGVMYLQVPNPEEFEATINALHYPPQFAQCLGIVETGSPGFYVTQQTRKSFGLCYRTMVGTPMDADFGYKLHLIYNALASPSVRNFNTISDSPSPSGFSWKIVSKPQTLSGYKQASKFVLDSRVVPTAILNAIEDVLYGSSAFEARLPFPDEIFDIFESLLAIVVVDNGDGTFTVSGPTDAVHMLDATKFEINSPSAVVVDTDSYTLTTTT
jgi:hypothetical protein